MNKTLRLTEGITYRLIMLKADIASYDNKVDEAEKFYQEAKTYLDQRYSEIGRRISFGIYDALTYTFLILALDQRSAKFVQQTLSADGMHPHLHD